MAKTRTYKANTIGYGYTENHSEDGITISLSKTDYHSHEIRWEAKYHFGSLELFSDWVSELNDLIKKMTSEPTK